METKLTEKNGRQLEDDMIWFVTGQILLFCMSILIYTTIAV